MAENEKKEILLGDGDLYMYEFTGSEIPDDKEIETEENNVGNTSGGTSIEYAPEPYEVKNQYGKTVKRTVTSEEVTFKSGLLDWDLEKIKLLTTGNTKEDKEKGTRKLTFGGNNPLKNVLVRFVHTKDNGLKVRFTMIGSSGNGFEMEFDSESETVVDAEFTAVEVVKNFLAEIEEELGNTLDGGNDGDGSGEE